MRTPLMDDRRFRALTLTLRGAYATLLDEADAAGVYAPAPGSTLGQAVAIALGCSEADGAGLVDALREGGAVEAREASLVLLVGTGSGSSGGKSKALLMRESRARAAAAKAPAGNVAGNPSGNGGGNAGSNIAVTEASNAAASPVTDDAESKAFERITTAVTEAGNGTAAAVGAEGAGCLPSAPLPSLPPHTPPSLTLPPAAPPSPPTIAHAREGGASAAIQPTLAGIAEEPPAEGKRSASGKAPRVDGEAPATGTPAAAVLAALVETRRLREIVRFPNDLAHAVTNGAFEGVDVVRELRAADTWLVNNRKRAKADGARFFNNWLTEALDRSTRRAASAAQRTIDPRPAPLDPYAPKPAPAARVVRPGDLNADLDEHLRRLTK